VIGPDPILVHALQIVTVGADYAKQISIDSDRNIILCRMRSSLVKLVQLMPGTGSKIIERIKSYDKETKMTVLLWMGRMDCYADGSSAGLLRLRDIAREGECFMQLKCDFSEGISMLSYSK
jgi:hypothetical protein